MKTLHKHAEFIHAWADGAEIEGLNSLGEWVQIWVTTWSEVDEFRIRPESKPDTVWSYNAFEGYLVRCDSDSANLKLIFDGETGNLKAAEVIE